MEVDQAEKVIERLGTTEGVTLVIKREIDGKMRVTSTLWKDEVLGKHEVLEVPRRG